VALENIVNSFNYKQNGWITQYISSSFFIKYSSVTFDLLFLVTWTCCLLGGQFVGELSRTVERLGMYDRIAIRRTCSRRGRYSILKSWFTYCFGLILIIIPSCINDFFKQKWIDLKILTWFFLFIVMDFTRALKSSLKMPQEFNGLVKSQACRYFQAMCWVAWKVKLPLSSKFNFLQFLQHLPTHIVVQCAI